MHTTVSSDPIADMLTRVRNAIAVRRNEVTVPHSKAKESIARLLKRTAFIDDVKVDGEKTAKLLTLVLGSERGATHITEIDRLSKPGRRQYAAAEAIPVVMRGRGIVVVSTSKGLMTGDEAKKAGIGGELICKVY